MRKLLKITLTLFITTIIVLGFALPLNPVGNWYQQFMPSIGSRSVQDIYFLDSITGWAVTNKATTDTMFVLKTTNSGDNWFIHYRKVQTGGGTPGYNRVYFINQNTGYVCYTLGFDKTTDGGANWTSLITTESFQDMSIRNTDTIWLVSVNPLTGGVFRTTNGGINWEQQLNIGSQNPNHIYMVNARIGFICEDNLYLRKTSNSGVNWAVIPSADGFLDMCFADTLTGWKCIYGSPSVKRTTDGGLNWVVQQIPIGGILTTSQVTDFGFINRDTIWGTGGQANISGNGRGVIYKTTNAGLNWKFQIPDTNFGIGVYGWIQFINNNTGWASGQIYNSQIYSGIHTTNGGDTTFYIGIQQISSEIPEDFKLYQNYPNPFNPVTNIKYQIINNSYVKLTIFDITGREITTLVNDRQTAGTYNADWNASAYSSGVYFYAMFLNGLLFGVKKMILIK